MVSSAALATCFNSSLMMDLLSGLASRQYNAHHMGTCSEIEAEGISPSEWLSGRGYR